MTLPTVSAGEKEIARFLETRFGGRPKFFIHCETPEDTLHIAVAEKPNYSGAGLTTCAAAANEYFFDLGSSPLVRHRRVVNCCEYARGRRQAAPKPLAHHISAAA